jgi:hypothetical protein
MMFSVSHKTSCPTQVQWQMDARTLTAQSQNLLKDDDQKVCRQWLQSSGWKLV